jgi:hypothetical protein
MTDRCEARYIEDGWVDMLRCEKKPHENGYHHAGGTHWTDGLAIWPKGADLKIGAASEKQVGGEHYRGTAIQPWDIIDDHGLDYYRGNALKYLLRAGKKGSAVQDLRKAIHYIEKCIEKEG